MGKKNRQKKTESSDEQIGLGALFRLVYHNVVADVDAYVAAPSSPFTNIERRVLGYLFLDQCIYYRQQAAIKLGIPLAELKKIEVSAVKKLQDRFGANNSS